MIKQTEDIKKLLSSPKKIVITTHHKPDADAMGSSLALKQFLLKKSHNVSLVVPTDYASFLFWMKGNNSVIMYDHSKHQTINQLFSDADIIFCLDFNSLKRINELGEMVEKSKAVKIMIDHHQQPDNFQHLAYWDANRAATAELVYELINDMNEKHLIDKAMGECIYAGIMTDTGSFRFPSTSKRIHQIIGELLEIGVDNAKIHRLVYDTSSENKLRFTGYAISQKLVVLPEYRTAYIPITTEELKKYNIQTGDTEGLVNYALSVEGIVFAVLIIDREVAIKLSFRSIGDFSVNDFGRKHFEGGGHKNAAGGISNLTLEETVKRFEELLPQYKTDLDREYLKEIEMDN